MLIPYSSTQLSVSNDWRIPHKRYAALVPVPPNKSKITRSVHADSFVAYPAEPRVLSGILTERQASVVCIARQHGQALGLGASAPIAAEMGIKLLTCTCSCVTHFVIAA